MCKGAKIRVSCNGVKMDLITNRTIDLTKLAMDGLLLRQKAITANTANVMTPDYQRKDVDFENQLKEIVEKDDLKTYIKEQNSMEYNPSSLDLATNQFQQSGLTQQQAKYLQSDVYRDYDPQIEDDTVSGSDNTGNNVNLETEVMGMANVGMKYNVLATLEQKQLHNISSAIKGDVS
jgi:flagellar basal body rod protein FlgB